MSKNILKTIACVLSVSVLMIFSSYRLSGQNETLVNGCKSCKHCAWNFTEDLSSAESVKENRCTEGAQTAEIVNAPQQKSGVVNPWHFSAEAGTQVYFGMSDSKMSFGERLTPTINISIGRSFTHVIGIDLLLSATQFKGVCSPLAKDAFFLTSQLYKSSNPDEKLMLQKGYYMNLAALMTVNLTNWFGGVNPARRSGVVWNVGGGWAHGFGCDRGANAPTINTGFVYNYYFTPRLALDIDLYGALVGSYFEGEHCNEHAFHGFTGLTAGITYRF